MFRRDVRLRILLGIVLTGCSVPAVAPRIDAVTPGLFCADATNEVRVTGAGFTPVVTGLLTEPTAALPAITLLRKGGIDGTDDGVERRIGLAASAGEVRWVDQDTLAFDASPAMGLVPGAWDVIVTLPDGREVAAENALLLAPAPTVDALAPEGVCLDAVAAPVTVSGTGFIVLADGSAPTFTLGGSAPMATAAEDCAPLVGERGAQVCATLLVTVDATTYPLGDADIVVTNPVPAACVSTTPASLEITLPPTIDGVDPTRTCADGGQVRIAGERFPIDPVVTVGGVEAVSATWVSETTIDAVLSADTPSGLEDVVVTGADSCVATAVEALTVVSSPDVYFVDPPALPDSLSVRVTAYVADVTGTVDEVWLTDGAGGETDLAFEWDPDEPGRVYATIPAGLPAGSYGFGISESDGCGAELTDALTIAGDPTVAIEELDPAFAWEWDYTPVQVVATDPVPSGQVGFSDTPRVYLTPSGGGTTATAVEGVVYRSGALLTATVPPLLEPGDYDVLVVNPDGSVGLLTAGLTVTDAPAPLVDSVSPASLSSTVDEIVTVHGRYFRDPTVDMECEEAGVITTAAGAVVSSDYTTIEVELPSSSYSEAVCVLTVTNSDGTSGRWAAVSIRNPAANLFAWEAGTEMVEARRAPAAVAGRTSTVSRWVYAIGGDDGDPSGAFASVERAPVGVYGDLGEWEVLPGELPTPLTLAGAVIIRDFVYVVGGDDRGGATSAVRRARVLDPLEIPRFSELGIDDGGTLTAGDWAWRVSALYDATDAANPGGESLPSDPIRVTLREDGLSVSLTWDEMDGAVGYRVYRSPAAGSGDAEWVADTVEPAFEDLGDATDSERTPLPEGALGEWATMPSMLTARSAACVTTAPDPIPDPEVVHLYVAGGQDADGDPLDTIERLPIIVVGDGEQNVGSWEIAEQTLSEARWGCGAYTVDDALHTVVAPDESWVYFVGGENGTRTVGTADAGLVTEGGGLSDWQEVDSMSPARSGFGVASASDYIYAFGGQNGGPSEGGVSTELVAGDMPTLQNWNNLGISLSEPRHLPGSAQESSVIVLLGGETDTASATRSTDVTHY